MKNRVSPASLRCLLLLWSCFCGRVPAAEPTSFAARSDIAIGQPNILPSQALGLGNGRLGAAFWAADGLSVQLNRADTLPGRLSPGQVIFPGLKMMTADRAFHGRLDLTRGALEESGHGIALKAIVDRRADRVIVDLAGLPPDQPQRIVLQLWAPRQPTASVHGDIALLAEDWRDDTLPGASARRFGSIAALKAIGRDSSARVVDARTLEVSAHPDSDGHLRVLIAAPAFDRARAAVDVARATLAIPVDLQASAIWWQDFWSRTASIRAESKDGVARYAETLRTLYLFAAAAHNGDGLPGSQAGIADLFSSSKDAHFWDPAAFWFWNLRMQVGANLAAGVPELNEPTFALYRNNLDAIQRWTRQHMGDRAGICVPETMRFNGKGVEYESDRFRPFAIVTHSCDLAWSDTSNARTLSTGAEIGLWVWRTYQQTHDRAFLAKNYPLMAEASRFLLAYQRSGDDGKLHTQPSNAHETQIDVRDPATDIAAIRSLYPAVIAAAAELGRDSDLAARLRNALALTPPLPLMAGTADSSAAPSTPSAPPAPIFAASYLPASPYRNGENIGLEAVWPYALIGADDAQFDIARRTYAQRPFVYQATWSYDPLHAARLGLGDEMAAGLAHLIEVYQAYPNGMAALGENATGEFYIEQAGIVALALSEALAIQDSDGLVRIAPALPSKWTMSGTVPLRDGIVVAMEAVDGRLVAFTLQGGSGRPLEFATPWAEQRVRVLADGLQQVPIAAARFRFTPARGVRYRFESSRASTSPVFAHESAARVKSLGRASIGFGPPCCAPPAGYDIGADRSVDP
ncbi:MAG: hypothetical protein ABW187_06925 [Dokdonella sp.]